MSKKRMEALECVIGACASLVTAAFTIIAAGSFASLIFSGPLKPYVSQGIWIALFTAFVVGLIVSLLSSYEGAIAIPQDRVAPILALMAGSIVTRMGDSPIAEKCLVVMTSIAAVTLVTGVFLFILGKLRLGNIIRYIPYPVIGGFLAGSGWLLVRGAFRVMTGHPLGFKTIGYFFQEPVFILWLPGLVFGGLLFLLLRKLKNPLTVPLMLVGGIGLFFLVTTLTGMKLETARGAGWLPNFSSGSGLAGFSPLYILNFAPWYQMMQEWSILATILLTSVVSILLTASALELGSESEIDLNRELRAAGIASFAAGIGGGMVGFQSLSMSRLVVSMGASKRWIGAASAIICGLAIFVGPSIISFIPQYVCGGLLFFLGLTFLWEWVYEARKTLTTLDYAVVLLILAVVGAVGYPEGVGVGIIAAVVMFIHNYSRVEVVTHSLSGSDIQSNVERPVGELRILREAGGQIYILRLQGFIFFGTANHLLHKVRLRSTDQKLSPLRYVILDFRRVTGLDSSAIFSLNKVLQVARKNGFVVLMSEISKPILGQFKTGGLTPVGDNFFQIMPDLDHALEWCEEKLLAKGNGDWRLKPLLLKEQLKDAWPAQVEPARLMPYLNRMELEAAIHLIRESEQSEALYFIESGTVTARLELADGRTMRLRSLGAGTVVGEVGLFLGGTRSASVVTDEACTVYRMTSESLERMSQEEPDLALAFHRYIICLLGERLTTNSRILRSVIE